MVLRKYKYAISSLLLIAFLTVKVVGAHSFVHFSDDTDTIETCILCDHFLGQNETPLVLNTVPDFKPAIAFISQEVNLHYAYIYHNKELSYHFYNKPPPASL